MLGKPYTSFVSGDEREEFDLHFQATTIGETRRFEASIFNSSNGEERRVVMTYSPIHEDGKVLADVEAGYRATMTALLGRTAIHSGRVVGWEEIEREAS